jgi:uncharacterized protein YbjT (DUF2867 family)
MTTDKTILVTGATGRQGGAVTRHLVAAGWRVRALSRDPNRPQGQALAKLGAEVVPGDLDDFASLTRALNGVYGVFSVQSFWEHGYEGEVRQGRNLAEAAATASRIAHFVYSSVGGADRDTGIAHFESKWAIEQRVRALGLPATILRPSFFMENFLASQALSPDGRLRMSLPADRPLQMIAVDDIGAFTALVFDRPGEFLARALELAGDERTMSEVVELFGSLLGREIAFEELPLDRLRETSLEAAAMFDWFRREGYRADIDYLRRLHPRLLTLRDWILAVGVRFLTSRLEEPLGAPRSP